MSMKVTDKIIAAPRGSLAGARDRAKNAYRLQETIQYINHLFEYAVKAGVDPAIAFAQWDLETDTGRSSWWADRLNPAGIGITGDPRQNAISKHFTSESAARAQIAHLLLYSTGEINRGGLTPADSPRYEAYRSAFGNKPVATTINDLSNRWAVDSQYGQKIVSRGNAIWPELGRYIPPASSAYAAPDVILNEDGTKWMGDYPIIVGNTIVFAQRRSVRVMNLTKARRWGTINAEEVAPPYQPDDYFEALGFYRGKLGNESGFWWITKDYHRVWAGDTYDQPFELR